MFWLERRKGALNHARVWLIRRTSTFFFDFNGSFNTTNYFPLTHDYTSIALGFNSYQNETKMLRFVGVGF